MYKPKTWQYELTGTAGNVELFGIKIFDYPWESAGKRAEVRHPSGEMGSYCTRRWVVSALRILPSGSISSTIRTATGRRSFPCGRSFMTRKKGVAVTVLLRRLPFCCFYPCEHLYDKKKCAQKVNDENN